MAGIVAISGTLHSPSRTERLLEALLTAIAERTGMATSTVRVLDHGHALVDALATAPGEDLADAYAQVVEAELLIVASPVYKASYTGILKSFFDPLDQNALAGRPVLIAATGGNELHSLVLDHQLRPLFAFFRANVLPIGVYAKNADFLPDGALAPGLAATIEEAADLAAAALS
jgi:FMN reductase